MTQPTAKPCPFCESVDIAPCQYCVNNEHEEIGCFMENAQCKNRGAYGPQASIEEFCIEAWNRRAAAAIGAAMEDKK